MQLKKCHTCPLDERTCTCGIYTKVFTWQMPYFVFIEVPKSTSSQMGWGFYRPFWCTMVSSTFNFKGFPFRLRMPGLSATEGAYTSDSGSGDGTGTSVSNEWLDITLELDPNLIQPSFLPQIQCKYVVKSSRDDSVYCSFSSSCSEAMLEMSTLVLPLKNMSRYLHDHVPDASDSFDFHFKIMSRDGRQDLKVKPAKLIVEVYMDLDENELQKTRDDYVMVDSHYFTQQDPPEIFTLATLYKVQQEQHPDTAHKWLQRQCWQAFGPVIYILSMIEEVQKMASVLNMSEKKSLEMGLIPEAVPSMGISTSSMISKRMHCSCDLKTRKIICGKEPGPVFFQCEHGIFAETDGTLFRKIICGKEPGPGVFQCEHGIFAETDASLTRSASTSVEVTTSSKKRKANKKKKHKELVDENKRLRDECDKLSQTIFRFQDLKEDNERLVRDLNGKHQELAKMTRLHAEIGNAFYDLEAKIKEAQKHTTDQHATIESQQTELDHFRGKNLHEIKTLDELDVLLSALIATQAKVVAEKNKRLLDEITKYKQALECSVCFERRKDCLFGCGHAFCTECAKRVVICPTCRQSIQVRTKMF